MIYSLHMLLPWKICLSSGLSIKVLASTGANYYPIAMPEITNKIYPGIESPHPRYNSAI